KQRPLQSPAAISTTTPPSCSDFRRFLYGTRDCRRGWQLSDPPEPFYFRARAVSDRERVRRDHDREASSARFEHKHLVGIHFLGREVMWNPRVKSTERLF